MKRTIGVISGTGAAAGCHLASKLVRECQLRGAKTDADFPEFILHSTPYAGATEKGFPDDEKALAALKTVIEGFNDLGVGYIIIACNTAHKFLPYLFGMTQAKIVSMIEAAVEELADPHGRVTILCSAQTRQEMLYDLELSRFDMLAEYPTYQGNVDHLIESLIGKAPNHENQSEFDALIAEAQKKTRNVIVGCTELSMLDEYYWPGVTDAVGAVVRKTLDLWQAS